MLCPPRRSRVVFAPRVLLQNLIPTPALVLSHVLPYDIMYSAGITLIKEYNPVLDEDGEDVLLRHEFALFAVGKLKVGPREAVDENLVAGLDSLALGAGADDLAGDGGPGSAVLGGRGEEDAARGGGLNLVGDDEDAVAGGLEVGGLEARARDDGGATGGDDLASLEGLFGTREGRGGRIVSGGSSVKSLGEIQGA